MSATSDRIRIEWAAGDKARDEGLTTPENVIRYDNIQYASDPKWNLLDVYIPKATAPSTGHPVIVNFHGGGYVYGSKDIYQFYGLSLCTRGFAFINPSYRLAPENKFPAALKDMNQVIEFVFKNAGKFNLDLNNIFFVGDSAGGHYAALYTCICTNDTYADSLNITVPDMPNGSASAKRFIPNAIALNCGIYDPLVAIDDNSERNDYTTDLLGSDWKETYVNTACTPNFMTKDFPPTYLMSGSNDFLMSQLPMLDQKLKELGIPHIAKIYGAPGEDEYYHVFHVNMRHPKASKVNDDECAFFKKYLK